MIVRVLYGLNSSGEAFKKHLVKCMVSLEYKSCLADPDLLYRVQVDGCRREYYSYIPCYVDDILVIHYAAMPVLSVWGQLVFRLVVAV